MTTLLAPRSARYGEHPAASSSHAWWWLGYLLGIALAELATVFWNAEIGLCMHFVVLIILIVRGSSGPDSERPLAVALTIAPLVRIVTLTLPLASLPPLYW